jgi:hypothetical protein
MWVNVHQLALHVVWSAASVAKHRALAAALGLDYDLHTTSGALHTIVVRKVLFLSCITPSATLEKRKAPDAHVDGQNRVPSQQVGQLELLACLFVVARASARPTRGLVCGLSGPAPLLDPSYPPVRQEQPFDSDSEGASATIA